MKFFSINNLILNPKHIISISLEDDTMTITSLVDRHILQYASVEEAEEVMLHIKTILL